MEEVDAYISRQPWAATLQALRAIVTDSDLTEAFKWRAPCYTYGGKNVAMLGSFKDNCVLSFFKGELLADPENVLEKPGRNSRFVRLLRFTDPRQVKERERVVRAFVQQAIDIERAGKQVKPKKAPGEAWPEELQRKFAEVPGLEVAFAELTPGRQRGYLLYFNGAKQSATRTSRIQSHQQRILDGKGFHDCVCGLSQRMPRCDGSHKALKDLR
ncbi:DUF1801 domain-containing protein [Lewinella sp. IMCC34191]|uniref:DUF1801 domain-containing protein n=1 Tax=Lewinella sp. IMCC34191 TaxID=2259172 RepID=UPI000E24617B|nr:DUF1801 domain-containing protein [Lewinella sp. IMCC34191]